MLATMATTTMKTSFAMVFDQSVTLPPLSELYHSRWPRLFRHWFHMYYTFPPSPPTSRSLIAACALRTSPTVSHGHISGGERQCPRPEAFSLRPLSLPTPLTPHRYPVLPPRAHESFCRRRGLRRPRLRQVQPCRSSLRHCALRGSCLSPTVSSLGLHLPAHPMHRKIGNSIHPRRP